MTLPIIVNGRIDQPDDWDVFQFAGKSNETIVAEVHARRLDSPLDSVLKLTDAAGKLLAFNDDHEDLGAGVNTHHADSYLMAKLPADGTYYVHLGDTARNGGEEYGYRLRLSAPQPDFALRVVPSSLSLRGKATATAHRLCHPQGRFHRPDQAELERSAAGILAPLRHPLRHPDRGAAHGQDRPGCDTKNRSTCPSSGSAKIEDQEVTHEAVPAEDRMQAFLWRHLVPASGTEGPGLRPPYQPPPKRVPRARPPVRRRETKCRRPRPTNSAPDKPKFTKQQVAGRLRQLKLLFEEGLLTDDFYDEKVAECEAAR